MRTGEFREEDDPVLVEAAEKNTIDLDWAKARFLSSYNSSSNFFEATRNSGDPSEGNSP
jgi:hypothetical protein